MVRKVLVFGLFAIVIVGLVAGKRDEFPGRRQGGGSRGAVPVELTTPEACVTAGCEPQVED